MTLGYNSLEQATTRYVYSDAWREALCYQMARVSYRLMDQYLITGTVRRDGFRDLRRIINMPLSLP